MSYMNMEQPKYTLPGIIHYLQSEFTKIEKYKILSDLEKSEMMYKISKLESEKNSLLFINKDLNKRIHFLEKENSELQSKLDIKTETKPNKKKPNPPGLNFNDLEVLKSDLDLSILKKSKQNLTNSMKEIIYLFKTPSVDQFDYLGLQESLPKQNLMDHGDDSLLVTSLMPPVQHNVPNQQAQPQHQQVYQQQAPPQQLQQLPQPQLQPQAPSQSSQVRISPPSSDKIAKLKLQSDIEGALSLGSIEQDSETETIIDINEYPLDKPDQQIIEELPSPNLHDVKFDISKLVVLDESPINQFLVIEDKKVLMSINSDNQYKKWDISNLFSAAAINHTKLSKFKEKLQSEEEILYFNFYENHVFIVTDKYHLKVLNGDAFELVEGFKNHSKTNGKLKLKFVFQGNMIISYDASHVNLYSIEGTTRFTTKELKPFDRNALQLVKNENVLLVKLTPKLDEMIVITNNRIMPVMIDNITRDIQDYFVLQQHTGVSPGKKKIDSRKNDVITGASISENLILITTKELKIIIFDMDTKKTISQTLTKLAAGCEIVNWNHNILMSFVEIDSNIIKVFDSNMDLKFSVTYIGTIKDFCFSQISDKMFIVTSTQNEIKFYHVDI